MLTNFLYYALDLVLMLLDHRQRKLALSTRRQATKQEISDELPPVTTTMAGHEHILEKRVQKIKNFFNPRGLTCFLTKSDFVDIPTHPGPAIVTNIEKVNPNLRNTDKKALLDTMKR